MNENSDTEKTDIPKAQAPPEIHVIAPLKGQSKKQPARKKS
jgi:hypothetical protein